MINKKIIFPLFGALMILQLFVPANMIYLREKVLRSGTEFKIRTAPVDPHDPFRGKYVHLSFPDNTYPIVSPNAWYNVEKVYVILQTDSAGYAIIQNVTTKKPGAEIPFFKTTVNYVNYEHPPQLVLDYPFDRFYMEETKAPKAEIIYRQMAQDSLGDAYALVSVKNGMAVLKDVMVDNVSLRELARGGD